MPPIRLKPKEFEPKGSRGLLLNLPLDVVVWLDKESMKLKARLWKTGAPNSKWGRAAVVTNLIREQIEREKNNDSQT